MKKNLGFSLIELMIVLAIIGILAAVAVPSYDNYVRKARRTDATMSILECAAKQERRFTLNNAYVYDGADPILCAAQSRDGYYTISVTNPGGGGNCATPGNCYLITATVIAAGLQGPDSLYCNQFRLDSRSVQTAFDNNGNPAQAGLCWRS